MRGQTLKLNSLVPLPVPLGISGPWRYEQAASISCRHSLEPLLSHLPSKRDGSLQTVSQNNPESLSYFLSVIWSQRQEK